MKKIIIIMIGLISIITIISIYNKNNSNKETTNTFEEQEKEQEEEKRKQEQEILDKINSMTLEEKIGQMLIIAYRKSDIEEILPQLLEDTKAGGFILFSENITTYEETLNLVKNIKNSNEIPLFIGIDEEGGSVQRLKNLKDYQVSDVPYMSYITDSTDAYNIGKLLAEELRVFGINLDFAPVIDCNYNNPDSAIGKRAFLGDYYTVAKLGTSAAQGLLDNKVIPVYKHFPNHGATTTDSHQDLPVINKTKEELMNNDLIPYKIAIENKASIIMVGHLALPKITNDYTPASLSYEIITNILKKELGFNGLVVTDALNMKALTKNYTSEEILIKAINAGIDLLLMPEDPQNAIKIIKEAVLNGTITEERIDESVKKILSFKDSNIKDTYNDYLDVSYLNSSEHQNIINNIYSKSNS